MLTGLGVLAIIVVVIGVLIIARSVARPLSVITDTIKRVAEGAEGVEVPHADRGDEIGALARAIKIFQEAMDRNRNLNSQVVEDSKAREERTRQIEASVDAFREAIGGVLRAVTDNATSMRGTAETIASVASDAERTRGRSFRRHRAGFQQRFRGRGRRRRTVRFRRGNRPAGSPVRQRGRRPACARKNPSPKSKGLPPQRNASTACSI